MKAECREELAGVVQLQAAARRFIKRSLYHEVYFSPSFTLHLSTFSIQASGFKVEEWEASGIRLQAPSFRVYYG